MRFILLSVIFASIASAIPIQGEDQALSVCLFHHHFHSKDILMKTPNSEAGLGM